MAKKSNPRKTIQPAPLVVRDDYQFRSGMRRKSAYSTPWLRRYWRRRWPSPKSEAKEWVTLMTARQFERDWKDIPF